MLVAGRVEHVEALRATARAHITCDGRSLGRILATAVPEELPDDDDDSLDGGTRAPERSDSVVQELIHSRLSTFLT